MEDITKTYRVVISKCLLLLFLRNENDKGVIEGIRDLNRIESGQKSFRGKRANNMPMALKEKRGHTIKAKSFSLVGCIHFKVLLISSSVKSLKILALIVSVILDSMFKRKSILPFSVLIEKRV